MQRKKIGPLALILVVLFLTVYNILPTIFYYTKPLASPLSEKEGIETASEIVERLNALEEGAVDWLHSYCKLLDIHPSSVSLDQENPLLVHVQCVKSGDAERLRKNVLRAGSLISHVPAQLIPLSGEPHSKTVSFLRRIPVHIEENNLESFFVFTPRETDSALAPLYVEWIEDRASAIALAAEGEMQDTALLQAADPATIPDPFLLDFSSRVNEVTDLFRGEESILGRFSSQKRASSNLFVAIDHLRDRLKSDKSRSSQERESSLTATATFLKKQLLSKEKPREKNENEILITSSPFFSHVRVDYQNNTLALLLHSDVEKLRKEWSGVAKDRLEQLLINEIARIARHTDEVFLPKSDRFLTQLHRLPDAKGFLFLKLDKLEQEYGEHIAQLLDKEWHPHHPDLLRENFPIVDQAAFASLPEPAKKLCLSIATGPAHGLKTGSVYVIAKGLNRILTQANLPGGETESRETLQADFDSLADLLRRNGFLVYPASPLSPFAGDYLFECPDAASSLLKATREEFYAKGSKKFAVLECSSLEQRLLTKNRIDTHIHEDLLKWRDEYSAAHITSDSPTRFDVPKPTKSVFWSNVSLSLKKYLRGDDRKILHWGLDLSGGKTVQIELRDANQRLVENDSDLKQGMNELYNRVNKMGVSDVAIRQVGKEIVLDFPGSQALSAKELIKASSMSFHIVNERFATTNPLLADAVHRFLQEIWNEAVVMNHTDPESVNAIAWEHLHGTGDDPQPHSAAARVLFEEGLRLQPPSDPSCSSTVNDAVSKIAILRGKDFSEWNSQSHPLLIVFANYALEGSNLTNIRASYDPSKGNFLSFEVKGSPSRDALQAWTSQFSKEMVAGTPNEAFTRGQGWRMAVILNDSVISSPTLNSALRDSAMISGSFSQREVNQLASDLKAGSLTFTPHILSEKNVSPELGKLDRTKGLFAAAVGLLLVTLSMIVYYRFAGIVASVAVLFNLLIMWATLQNLQATLSLAGIAGIILTVGMAVDANVLVFERIKEEFALTGRLATALAAGYKKAFSAILDSNVTTVIAALILLNFDAGPIKGFAITLIIGIVSSMFTALFMTRTFFSYWIENPAHKTLKMSNWIRATSYDFIKKAPIALGLTLVIILVGGGLLVSNRASILGMDFTGGFTVDVELERGTLEEVTQAFLTQGASSHDIQVRELSPQHMRLFFGTAGQVNIQWIQEALAQSDLPLTPASFVQMDSNWTAMSGQMSDHMRNNALLGLGLAFLCIFVYLVFRFEAAYATSAVVCLFVDLFITLGIMGILHTFKVPVQIDLNTIAALMTIIGYSLNDKIIVFDRIREEVKRERGKLTPSIVNHALNATLSRTSITSGTTLLVLLALVILGSSSIFSFALVMTIGVVFGTLSSWFIAAPLLLYVHGKREKKERHLANT